MGACCMNAALQSHGLQGRRGKGGVQPYQAADRETAEAHHALTVCCCCAAGAANADAHLLAGGDGGNI